MEIFTSDPRKKDNTGSNQIIHYFGMEIRRLVLFEKRSILKVQHGLKCLFDNYGKITWDFNKGYKDKQ